MNLLFNLFRSNDKTLGNNKADVESLSDTDCPYCKETLSPMPARKKKCPHCGETIVVRTHFKTKEKILLTEHQVKKFDIEKEKYYAVTSFLRGMTNFGVEKKELDSLVEKHTEILKKKFGFEPPFADVAWGVSNKLITLYPDLSHGIHIQQAMFMHREGKDPTKIRQMVFADNLKEYKKWDVVHKVEVITAGEESCEHCRKLEGKKFTLEEALKEKILPCNECSYNRNKSGVGWCRCCYSPIV